MNSGDPTALDVISMPLSKLSRFIELPKVPCGKLIGARPSPTFAATLVSTLPEFDQQF